MKNWLRHHKETWLLILAPFSMLLLFLARISPFFAEEIFAKRIYKVCSVVLNRITGIVPFSLAELLVIGLLFGSVFFLIRFLVRLARGCMKKEQASGLQIAGSFVLHLCCFLSAVLFLFTFFCGVNYERYPFSYYSGLTIESSEKQELYELCVSLAVRAGEAREEVMKTAQEGMAAEETVGEYGGIGLASGLNYRELAGEAAKAMSALGKEYPVLAGAYTIPKPVFFSEFMSMTETTGIFIPFTMEANVNVDCTDFTIPAAMCHELSHLRGFMREDEANYIAYLACQKSENPYLQYSGLMLALVYAGNQLYREDKELYAKAGSYYSAGVTEDFRRDSLYWSKYEDTAISAAANAANDTYLKANNQTDGTKSYGRMVDLLLAEYRRTKNQAQQE